MAQMKETITLLLVGKSGNGKSATGNSILGTKSFESKLSLRGTTLDTKMDTQKVKGRFVKVIDTPGLFNEEVEVSFITNQITKCIELAKDGIHGILVVLSLTSRFSEEEAKMLPFIQGLFGKSVLRYVIVIFTNGDVCDNDEDGQNYVRRYIDDAPPLLKTLLDACHHRYVVFDNKTKDPSVKENQVSQLLALVDNVLAKNGYQPYTTELFKKAQDLKRDVSENEHTKIISDEVQIKLLEMMAGLQQQSTSLNRGSEMHLYRTNQGGHPLQVIGKAMWKKLMDIGCTIM